MIFCYRILQYSDLVMSCYLEVRSKVLDFKAWFWHALTFDGDYLIILSFELQREPKDTDMRSANLKSANNGFNK